MTNYLSMYAGKKVLVTGGAGAIGSRLVARLAEIGASVVVLDDFSSAYQWNVPSIDGVMLVQGDINDEVLLKRVFTERVDQVFHLAAFFANQNSVDHPELDLRTNGLGTLKLLEYSVLAGIEGFVFASSGCSIYGSSAPLPLREEFMSLHLSSPYQITKMLGELYCNFFSNHYDLSVVKTRFFNSYGPGEVPGQYRNVIPNFVYWAMKGMELPITGDGSETRDFTYVGDIVDGLLRAGVNPSATGQEFNLASGRETEIAQLAKTVNEITGNTAGVRFTERRNWDNKSRVLASTEKAQKLIGYEPKTSLAAGLDKTVAWFSENWDLIERDASFLPGISSAVRDTVSK